jgi:hypothetical protein
MFTSFLSKKARQMQLLIAKKVLVKYRYKKHAKICYAEMIFFKIIQKFPLWMKDHHFNSDRIVTVVPVPGYAHPGPYFKAKNPTGAALPRGWFSFLKL